MKILICVPLVILIPALALTQSEWRFQNPWPQGNHLIAVESLSDSVAVAVGWGGTVIRTMDAGTSWKVLSFGWNLYMMDIAFNGSGVGIAVGADMSEIQPVVLRSSDSGVTWAQVPFSEFYPSAVIFTGAGTGVIGTNSGAIYRSTDAGLSWESTTGNPDDTILDLSFTTAGVGLASGYSGIISRTTDDGLSWASISGGGSGWFGFNSISFLSPSTALSGGTDGSIYRSTDAGETWDSISHPTMLYVLGLAAVDSGRALLVGSVDNVGGDQGVLMLSTDQGSGWTDLSSQISRGLAGIDVSPNGVGIAVGSTGAIYRSIDSGAVWDSLMRGPTDQLLGVRFIDRFHGWAVGGGIAAGGGNAIAGTSDGGSTWGSQASGVTGPLHSVYFLDQDTGWIVGGYYTSSSTILKTTNGGTSWEPRTSPAPNGLNDVFFATPSVGWAVGYGGSILQTTDGGGSWFARTSGTTLELTGVRFVNDSTGWAVGWNGTILKTTDGGVNWAQEPTSFPGTLYALCFADANTGWAAGSYGVVLRTTDSGLSWTGQTADPAGGTLWSVSFSDPYHGFAVGRNGSIFYTDNGGVAWIPQQSPTGNTLYGVCYLDDSTAWAVGARGTILAGEVAAPLISEVVRTGLGSGWQLVSRPLQTLVPGYFTLSPLWAYDSAYLAADTMELGAGYWVKNTGTGGINFLGYEPLAEVTAVLNPRWNIVGTPAIRLAASDVTTDPPSIETSQFFGYDPQTGYSGEDTLEPGHAYWVKSSEAGTMTLSALSPMTSTARIRIVPTTEEPPGPPANRDDRSDFPPGPPHEFQMTQNYPNPFNPKTTLAYTLPVDGIVQVRIFNILGEEVSLLVNEFREAGTYSAEWDASSFPSGVYYCRIYAGSFSGTMKMLMIR